MAAIMSTRLNHRFRLFIALRTLTSLSCNSQQHHDAREYDHGAHMGRSSLVNSAYGSRFFVTS